MADADFEDDLFADLYEDDAKPAAPAQTAAATAPPIVNGTNIKTEEAAQPAPAVSGGQEDIKAEEEEEDEDDIDINLGGNSEHHAAPQQNNYEDRGHGHGPPGGNKDDGKMFIGGLNWETTDQSLKDYFSQFGEVLECTVMRDGASGRSRGFGFLTFKDPRTVNVVMVKEHYLDGKIIDPKRAIPRDEQERTSKIFVGGVSQEASEGDFKEYFMQFGRVVDATLMMDKDTGRPRGFGFVTFDSEAAVDACLSQPLEILGKPIEVKKAQPRGNVREEEDRGGHGGKFGRHQGHDNYSNQNQGQQGMGQAPGGMTPQLMAQYWQRMQQYMAMMQQQMAMGGRGQMGGMQGMNPMMMQQMQQMQAMQAAAAQGGGRSQSPSGAGGMAGMQMNPMMMQQMMQQQQMAAAQAQGQGMMSPQPGNMGVQQGMGQQVAQGQRQVSQQPSYNAYEQQQFEQQKYEQAAQQPQGKKRQASQTPQQQQKGFVPAAGAYGQPTSWEGMYDDVPQPTPAAGFPNKKQNRGASATPSGPQPAPPAGAPTGPKNAGKPGANYRGGGRGSREPTPHARLPLPPGLRASSEAFRPVRTELRDEGGRRRGGGGGGGRFYPYGR